MLLPIIASAMDSLTYAFMPWITASTATRNATLMMMPMSVNALRSLLARICVRAVRRTSKKAKLAEDYGLWAVGAGLSSLGRRGRHTSARQGDW